MTWIITQPHNLPLIICGIFYTILSIISLVTGAIYITGQRPLNPLKLPKKFVKKFENQDELQSFTIKIGWLTFLVGILQGITAFAIFKGYSTTLYWISLGFTIFSIISAIFKLKRKGKIFTITKLLLYIIIFIILILSGSKNYGATNEAIKYLNSTENVKVSKTANGYFFDGPGTDTAIIFYPGARVDYTAYSKLMYKIAEGGHDCFLLGMPLNLAILNINAPNKIMNEYNYKNWYISGHSMGGVAACKYTVKNPGKISGIILFASYPTEELPSNIEFISFYGTQDKVLNLEKYKEAKEYWPQNPKEYIIEGGNHSGFANYGEQKGDNRANISDEVQQNYVVSIINQLNK